MHWLAETGAGLEQLGDILSVNLNINVGTVSGEALYKILKEFRFPVFLSFVVLNQAQIHL